MMQKDLCKLFLVLLGERVHYEAPPASSLLKEITDFIHWLNKEPEIDGLLVAAIAHLWFVTIHPFEDGNGRIAKQ